MKYLFLTLISLITISSHAETLEAEVSADIVSSYIWRGQDLGAAAIQPSLSISYGGLSFEAWGSYGIANTSDTKEFDLTLGYEIANLHLGITDYWFSTADTYFNYKSGESSHVFEANIGYDFDVLSLDLYTNFAGDDGLTPSGARAYSSYFEINAPFTLGGLEWNATLGVVPYATTLYNADNFAITNISIMASKPIIIPNSEWFPKVTTPSADRIPNCVYAGITATPNSKKAYLTFGISL